MQIKIRQLRKSDRGVIDFIKNRLSRRWQSSKREIEENYIKQSLKKGSVYIYIAFDEKGRFVGKAFLVIEKKSFLDISNKPWLTALFVKREFRGRGIAKGLIRKVEEKCRSLGYSELYLDTESTMEYYKRLGGWRIIGKVSWQKDKKTILTIMRKNL